MNTSLERNLRERERERERETERESRDDVSRMLSVRKPQLNRCLFCCGTAACWEAGGGCDGSVTSTERTRRKRWDEWSHGYGINQTHTHSHTRAHMHTPIISHSSIKVSLGCKPCFVTSKHFHNSWAGDSSIELKTKMSAL